jgi:ribosome assembly protein SQT1
LDYCDKNLKLIDYGLILEHDDSVVAVGFSPDEQFVASGGMDGKVHVSKVTTGELVVPLEGPTEVVVCIYYHKVIWNMDSNSKKCGKWLNWHPRGNVVLAGGQDGTVWMWQIPSGNCMAVFTGHVDQVTSGGFTPDGSFIF